jgi:preprotein translocase subunit SecE
MAGRRVGGPRVRGADSMSKYWLKVKEFFHHLVEFIQDTRKELKNVSWPSRQELISTTVVVIVTVFFFGTFLWVVDVGVAKAMSFVLRQLSS